MFLLFFFLLCPLRLEFSRIRKTTSFLTSNKLKIDKSASTDLHGLRENVVNVENSQFLRRNGSFFSVSWVKWNQSVYSITLPCSRIFYSLFLPFLVLEIFEFKYDKFFVRHSTSISKFKWFEQPWVWSQSKMYVPIKGQISTSF